jgi:hypothetical protein
VVRTLALKYALLAPHFLELRRQLPLPAPLGTGVDLVDQSHQQLQARPGRLFYGGPACADHPVEDGGPSLGRPQRAPRIQSGDSGRVPPSPRPSGPQTRSPSECTVGESPGRRQGRYRRLPHGSLPFGLRAKRPEDSSCLFSPPSPSTYTMRRSASLTSVRVTARRRRSVLDRQRQQLLAGGADLDVGVHLRPYTNRPKTALP